MHTKPSSSFRVNMEVCVKKLNKFAIYTTAQMIIAIALLQVNLFRLETIRKTMKKTIIFVLPIFLLLLNSIQCSAAEKPNPVRDFDGNELRTGERYFIEHSGFGFIGGVTMGRPVNSSERCPRTVIQSPFEVDSGKPVTFTPVNPKEGVIRVSTDLNIKFDAVTFCKQSNVWRLNYAEEIGQYIIVANGVEGNPGQDTIDNWFKIEENGSSYILRSCPTVCDFCKPICRDVGIFVGQDGTRRLVLSDKPATFFFAKANGRFSSTSII